MDELILQGNQNVSNPFLGLEKTAFLDSNQIVNLLNLAEISLHPSSLPSIAAVQDSSEIVPESLSWDNIFGWQPAITDILQKDIYPTLQQFVQSPDFHSQMHSVFGDSLDDQKLNEITFQWLGGNFSLLPQIEILNASVFPTGTLGAFAGETNKIYLSENLLNSVNTELIKDTIFEEIGHSLDKELNFIDTPGDEGQLFSAVVTGKQLNTEQITAIRDENDFTTILIYNQLLTVEQATLPTITIKASDATAGETLTGLAANPGIFTFTRVGDLTLSQTVNYTISGTATNGIDYNSLTGNVSFLAGASTTTVNINPIDDLIYEGNENIILTLNPDSTYLLGTTTTATVNLLENEPKPVITITANDNTSGEIVTELTQNPGQFTLTRTGDLSNSLTAYYTISGTAANTTDYTNIANNVTFLAGSSTAIVNINPVDDLNFEGNETVILTVAANAAYTVGTAKTATVNIVENDLPTITISVNDSSAGEVLPELTPNFGQFTFKRSGNTAKALTAYYTISGTATKGTDYTTITNAVTFAIGSSTATVNIAPIDDLIYEGNESVILTLNANSGYNIGTTNTSTVNIVENDLKPVIGITANDNIAGEVTTGLTPNSGQFTFTRTVNTAGTLTVSYTISGTATKTTDYTNITGTVTFADGADTAIVNINPVDDAVYEGDETVVLTLNTATNYSLATNKTATVNIVENDLPTITISANDNSATEVETGLTQNPGQFTLTRTGNTAKSLIVYYTISGTATNATDYNSLTGTATFAAGSPTALINLNVKDDLIYEGNETVVLTLNANATYNLGSAKTGTVTIGENDTQPVITITANDANAGEIVTGLTQNPGQFTLTRSGNLNGALTVYYTVSGTATNGTDYNNLKGTATFAASAATTLINLSVIDDSIGENNETAIITLTANSKYLLGTAKTATVTIADNESLPTITITANDANAGEIVTELTQNPGQFTLTRTGSTSGALTVNYIVSGTATNGVDYNNLTGSATFAAGSTTALINLNVIDDSVYEGTENVVLTLNTNSSYILGTAKSATVTIAENDPVPFINVTSPNGGESLVIGSNYNLTWADNIAENVNIYLYKGGAYNRTILSSTLSDGSENWLLPADLVAGSDYSIKITSVNNGSVADLSNSNFSIIPNHTGLITDFNKDGKTDILWKNLSSGEFAAWAMNGTTGTWVDIDDGFDKNDGAWYFVGTGDFNNDGNTDIIQRYHWVNSPGYVRIWLMNGNQHVDTVEIEAINSNDWHIAGTGDFNQDGNVDILLRNYVTGANHVWMMQNYQVIGRVDLEIVTDLNQRIVGTGDFNGDGKSDILWHNAADASNSIWYMNNTTVSSKIAVYGAGIEWHIMGAADFNNDGKSDIIWRNYDGGQNFVWLMNGNTHTGDLDIDDISDRNWTIVGKSDPVGIWTADYFGNIDLSGTPTSSEGFTDITGNFDRNWGLGAPPNTPVDNFSARYKTTRYFAPGLYRVNTSTDDGVRVWIGNERLIDRWIDQSPTTYSGYFRSTGGYYPVTVEYYERVGGASISFNTVNHQPFSDPVDITNSWSANIFHWDGQGSAPPANFSQDTGNFIGTVNLGASVRSDGQPGINTQNWGLGAPNGDNNRLPHDFFAIRAYTRANFEAGHTYKAWVRGDDGYQLFAYRIGGGGFDITPSGQWMYDYGNAREWTFTPSQSGTYDLHFQMFEGGGEANFDFVWKDVTPPTGYYADLNTLSESQWDYQSGDDNQFRPDSPFGGGDQRWKTDDRIEQIYTDLSNTIFGYRVDMNAGYAYDQSYYNGQGKWHAALDMGASYGATIKAVVGGSVAWTSGASDGYYFVGLNSDDGRQWVYGHLKSLSGLSSGKRINAGDTVGIVGALNHLHLEVENGLAYGGTQGAMTDQAKLLSVTVSPLMAYWQWRNR